MISHIYLRQQTVFFPQNKSFFATFAFHRLEWYQNIKRLWRSGSSLLFSRKTEWPGLVELFKMGWGHSISNLLIVYKHFWIEDPSMSLPNKCNHQTYQSDLHLLFMVSYFCWSSYTWVLTNFGLTALWLSNKIKHLIDHKTV